MNWKSFSHGCNACCLLCVFNVQFHLNLYYDANRMLVIHAYVSQQSLNFWILLRDCLLGLICPRFSLKTDYLHSGHMHLRYPPKTRLDGEQSSVKVHLTGKVRLTLRLYNTFIKSIFKTFCYVYYSVSSEDSFEMIQNKFRQL